MPGVILLTLQSYGQIRLVFKNVSSLENEDPTEVSTIKHELKMWQNTERSITTVSKFDAISRSVIHNRVVLLNEALQRELQSNHHYSSERIQPRNLSFYLNESKTLRSKANEEDNEAYVELVSRLEEMVNFCFFMVILPQNYK